MSIAYAGISRYTTPIALHRHLLGRAKLAAFIVTEPLNIRYLTGVSVSTGILLIRRSGILLFVDGRYSEAVQKDVCLPGLRVRSIEGCPKALHTIRRCGFEADRVTVHRLTDWKRHFTITKFVPREDVVEFFRREKRPSELRCIRRAERMTAELLRRVLPALRARPTERELAWRLLVWAHELGAEGLAFDPIVAFGSHTSRPHHHPTNRRLRKGDLVQVDVGAKYRGYCADRSMVYFTGEPTALQRKAYVAVEEALVRVREAVRVGGTNRALDRLARRVLQRHGFEKEFCHALGHGVGLEVHEGVTLSVKAPLTKLLHSEVIAIEPGLYFPGKFGMRLEEMVYVQ